MKHIDICGKSYSAEEFSFLDKLAPVKFAYTQSDLEVEEIGKLLCEKEITIPAQRKKLLDLLQSFLRRQRQRNYLGFQCEKVSRNSSE